MSTERNDLQTALDAEREKVKGLHEVTKVICAHCCEPMEIPSKAVLQTQLTQIKALVRALPMPEEGGFPIVEVDGDYYVNHTSRFSTKDEAEAYAKLLAYRATLDATTPAIYKRIVDDGFGSSMEMCGRKDCGLQVVRPGKFQCTQPDCYDNSKGGDGE